MSHRELIAGKDIRSVVLDPSGPRSSGLHSSYMDRGMVAPRPRRSSRRTGLRYRATRKLPERPLGHNRIHDLLRNPYYKGIVLWDGRRYPGRHEQLVSPETFDQVQILLAAARIGGDRPQIHEHYLR